jgi:phosphatidylglycerophosphate synthase
MVTLILSREIFLIIGFRNLTVSKGFVLVAQNFGKYTTFFQLFFIFIMILILLFFI